MSNVTLLPKKLIVLSIFCLDKFQKKVWGFILTMTIHSHENGNCFRSTFIFFYFIHCTIKGSLWNKVVYLSHHAKMIFLFLSSWNFQILSWLSNLYTESTLIGDNKGVNVSFYFVCHSGISWSNSKRYLALDRFYNPLKGEESNKTRENPISLEWIYSKQVLLSIALSRLLEHFGSIARSSKITIGNLVGNHY